MCILQEAPIEITEISNSSSKKNPRARNLSRRPMDLPTTIHPPNSPFHPYTPTFPLDFPSLQRKHRTLFLLFLNKKKWWWITQQHSSLISYLMHSSCYSFHSKPSSDVSSVPDQASARNFRGRSSYKKSCRILVTADPFKKKQAPEAGSVQQRYMQRARSGTWSKNH